jgi:large subunit ribosomal protein L4e
MTPDEDGAPPKGEADAGTKARPVRTRRARASKAAKATPAEEAAKSLESGQVHVYSLEGKAVRSVDLPRVFHADVREDLIRRAVTAFQANRRVPYGPSPGAGMRHSVRWSGKGQGVSRVPRIRGTMTGAQAPGTVGGRKAHPPRLEADWSLKINERERRLARNAALAALADASRVQARGHRFKDGVSLPLVVEDDIEALEAREGATKSGLRILEKLGVLADVDRAKEGRHVRAGRGKMRGRRTRTPRSLLVVVKDASKVRRFFGNLPGVDVIGPPGLNAEVLAPGGHAGRLALFSEGALDILRSWHG